MMWAEIKKLREEGRLEEAYEKGQRWLEDAINSGNANDTLWAKRAVGWVLYDKLKIAVQELAAEFSEHAVSAVFDVLRQIRELEPDENEEMFFGQMVWRVAEIAELFYEKRPEQVYLFNNLFESIHFANFPVHEDSYYVLLFRFHRGLRNDKQYIKFIDWWGIQHFREQDYHARKYDAGRTFPSMAEQVFNTYLKHIVEEYKSGRIGRDRAASVLEQFEPIRIQYPHFNYVNYRVAQLMYLAGDAEMAANHFRDFARKNSGQPWVWELMGDMNQHDPALQVSCYCRALLIKTKEDFLTNIRKKLAQCLINQQKWDEARTEIEQYISHRNNRGWKIPEVIKNHTSANWHLNAASRKNNAGFYKQHAEISLHLLYGDVPAEIVIIDHVDSNKKVLFYIKSRSETGSFKYSNLLKNPAEGDVLSVRLVPGSGRRKEVISAEHTSEKPGENLLKPFKGIFKKSGPIGFVHNGEKIFVKPETIKKYHISANTQVAGTAIASYDKKRKKWGWRVLKISKQEMDT